VRFAAVGASGVGVNLAALWLLAGVLHLHEVAASALAVEISILSNFALNDAFTFRDRVLRAGTGRLERLARYNLVSLVGLGVQLGTFVALRTLAVRAFALPALGPWRYAAQLAGIALALGWNFAGNLHFTWRRAPVPRERTA
jgi:putative flippase GtrA